MGCGLSSPGALKGKVVAGNGQTGGKVAPDEVNNGTAAGGGGGAEAGTAAKSVGHDSGKIKQQQEAAAAAAAKGEVIDKGSPDDVSEGEKPSSAGGGSTRKGANNNGGPNSPDSGGGALNSDRSGYDNYNSYTQYEEHGLTEADIRRRIDEAKATETMQIKCANMSYSIRYAHVSQRGFYPATPNKANQDAYAIRPKFMNDDNSLLAAVYDGHGSTGDKCAIYAAKHVPKQLEAAIKKKGEYVELSEEDLMECLTTAHLQADLGIKKATFDDSLSGTTACSMLLREDTVIVSNVGDSRAIIARQGADGLLKASPLSLDQTPFRKDERERIKAAGGKVMTIDQLEGFEPIHEDWDTVLGEELDDQGDPPRVWCEDLERPGCAFTRSLGDRVGKTVGVCAEPEMIFRRLTPKDRFIVVASDGVWEFLTSKQVMETIDRYDDPLEAARHVVQESFRLWLQYETRTDDITIAIIMLENFQDNKATDAAVTTAARRKSSPRAQAAALVADDGVEGAGMRPVRRHFGQDAKNRLLGDEKGGELGGTTGLESLSNTMGAEKTDEEIQVILECLRSLPLFAKLSATQLELIIQAMCRETVSPGDVVIKEKDQGDKFYMVGAGEYVVKVADSKGQDKRVGDITNSGSCFGELALMYGEPRTATITCTASGFLWTLDRTSFRHCIAMGILREVVLKGLRHCKEITKLLPSSQQHTELADLMQEIKLEDGEALAKTGDIPGVMYMVVAGEIIGSADTVRLGPKAVLATEVITLGLQTSSDATPAPFTMDYTAKGSTRLFTCTADDVQRVLARGPLEGSGVLNGQGLGEAG